MRLIYLGDIHGNFSLVNYYIDYFGIKDAHIIQVGDFGVGFQTFEKEKRMLEMYHHKLVKNNVFLYAVRGNHDFKGYFDNDPFGFTNIKLVKDYTVLNLEGHNILFLGGAVSVDRYDRKNKDQFNGIFNDVPGLNWWNNEEFVYDAEELGKFRDIDIVVTHTCPEYCPPDNTFGLGFFVEGIIRRTGDDELRNDLLVERRKLNDAFQILKMNNDIKFAYNGHYHKNTVIDIYGTIHRALGVGELWEENIY